MNPSRASALPPAPKPARGSPAACHSLAHALCLPHCSSFPSSRLGNDAPDVNDGGSRSGAHPRLICHHATAAGEATDGRTGCRLGRCRRQRDLTCRPPSRRIESRQANRSARRISYRLRLIPTQRRLHYQPSASHGIVRRRCQPTDFPLGAGGTGERHDVAQVNQCGISFRTFASPVGIAAFKAAALRHREGAWKLPFCSE